MSVSKYCMLETLIKCHHPDHYLVICQDVSHSNSYSTHGDFIVTICIVSSAGYNYIFQNLLYIAPWDTE
jgi:hypothetical protein